MFYIEPNYIFSFFIVCLIFSLLLFCISYNSVIQSPNPEKSSAYECGFNPFGDSRMKFEVKYFLVAILFIIFDLEISFIFPCAVNFYRLGFNGVSSIFVFVLILGLGFIYE